MSKNADFQNKDFHFTASEEYVKHLNKVSFVFSGGIILFVIGGIMAFVAFMNYQFADYANQQLVHALFIIFGLSLIVVQIILNRLKATRNACIATMIYTAQLVDMLDKTEYYEPTGQHSDTVPSGVDDAEL